MLHYEPLSPLLQRCFTLLVLLSLTAWLPAQIAAPDFLCTRSEAGGEILTWANVANDCGPYLATEIYRSESVGGPFTLLTSIADATLTEYRDENPAGQQLFYFLQYRYDCPGVQEVTSDTLDSFIPVTPELRYVSIEDGDLVLSWSPSPSPEVSGYVILEITDTGAVALDTVATDTSYRIPGVPANELTTRQYRIAAIDPCGNDSPQGTILTGVSLVGLGGEGCESRVFLNPDPDALAAFAPLVALELYVSVNGGPYTGQGPVPADSLTLIYNEGNDQDSLCFYVAATFTEGGGSARSEVFCKTIRINQPVRPFDLYGIELGDGGSLRIPYQEGGNPAPVTAELDLIGPAGQITYPLTDLLLGSGELIVTDPLPFGPGDAARITLTDDCGRAVTTNAVQPVFLAVEDVAGQQAQLNWTPLTNGLTGQITYTVLRSFPDGTNDSVAAGLQALQFSDDTTGNRCYRILATFVPEGIDTSYSFRSNEVCVAGPTAVYVPNAFSPTARQDVNGEFRPFFTNPPASDGYRLQVFNRWGGLVFESTDPGIGWTGDINGRAADVGAYVYTLAYVGPGGNLSRNTGVVNLIR